MNYIELINNFWRLNKEHSFTSNETQVYFKLLDTCNSLGWKNPFNQSNLFICAECGMSEPTLIRVRNSLKQLGLIDFISGKVKRQFTNYTIIGLNKFSLSSTLSVTLNDNLSSTLSVEKSLDNIKQEKQNKTKQNKDYIPPTPKGDESEKNWKNDFDVYREELRNAYKEIQNDADWIKQQESFYQNVDILKSIEKACVNYWATPAGWKKKKQSKITEINWRSTFGNAISLNKVYKNGNSNLQSGTSFGNTENKQNTRRTSPEDKREKLRGFGDMAQAILQNS